MKCNYCKKKIRNIFLNLGKTPPANSLLSKKKDIKNEKIFDLVVYVCETCWLVQTKQVADKKIFFNDEYPYFSSISKSWLKHCEIFANKSIKKFRLNKRSTVIEIASNDGYLLQYFKKKKIPCLGIEPTKNTAKICKKKGIRVMQKFFSYELSKKIKKKADLIICNNVLAHVPDLIDFIKGLENLIKDNGIISVEFPHLKNLISKVQFDTIYHEHYFYFSLISLNKIFDKYNLKIINVDKINTHGGSLRIDICKKENPKSISNKVVKILKEEKNFGLNNLKTYLNFKNKVYNLKKKSLTFINKCNLNKKKIYAYGAAAKGITFLNYLQIKKNDIKYIFDASKFKINKFLPSSHIQILSPNEIFKTKPNYLLILPWNLSKEISSELKFVKSWKCKFVTLVPKLKVF
jgi:2-polyprenyl-3-methyl-5-hydroxy-6-metoxy-1,4-benzoquinol methylase